jgi:hypothetical protein
MSGRLKVKSLKTANEDKKCQDWMFTAVLEASEVRRARLLPGTEDEAETLQGDV